MSTRSTVTVYDGTESFSIYRHSDGYPYGEHGVLHTLRKAFAYAWELPRYEAMDFAAAIVRAWKTGGGSVYFTEGRDAHGDTEFHYTIGKLKDQAALFVTVWVPTHREGPDALGERGWVKLISARITPDRVKLLNLSKADAAARSAAGVTKEWAEDLKRLREQAEYIDLDPAEQDEPAPAKVQPMVVHQTSIEGEIARVIDAMVESRVNAVLEEHADKLAEMVLDRVKLLNLTTADLLVRSMVDAAVDSRVDGLVADITERVLAEVRKRLRNI